jgi:dephospho-CoA kinase
VKIGVTGGIGAGKSTISHILANSLGAFHIDSDEICRQQLQPGTQGFVRFTEVFGSRFFRDNGTIDRDKLRKAVFNDRQSKNDLEAILHPLVRMRIEELAGHCALSKTDLVVEVPLLFETGWQGDFDTTVTVKASRAVCLDRVFSRDGLNHQEVSKIIDSQLSPEKKVSMADHLVDNSGTIVSTVQQIRLLTVTLRGYIGSPQNSRLC